MKKSVKITAIVCVLVLLLSLFAFAACNKDKDKRAIIFVTALFAGGFYDSSTNEAKWDPIKADVDISAIMSGEADMQQVLQDVLDGEEGGIASLLSMIEWKKGGVLYDLSLDEDGQPLNPDVVPANGMPLDEDGNVMDVTYGVCWIYKPIYDALYSKYGGGADVVIYNQDWRLSPAQSAAQLERFINDQKYTDVVLMSHSMGGAVVNSYLARSAQNREKVRLNLGFAPAALGSFDALAALSCPLDYLDAMLGSTDNADMIKSVVRNVLNSVGDFLTNNTGLISLVPSWQLLSSAQYEAGAHGITVDGVAISTKEELYNFYKTQPWAYYMVDGEDDGVAIKTKTDAKAGQAADPDGKRIKESVGGLENYFDSLFVGGKLAAEAVNSYYFVGSDSSTIVGLDCTTMRDGEGNVMYDSDGNVRYNYTLRYARNGDGVVPFYSSIGGSAADVSALEQSGRLITYQSQSHINVGADWSIMQADAFRLIDSVFGN